MKTKNTVSVNSNGSDVTPATVSSRKSQKGKWGLVGAPPKEIKYPRGSFTIKEVAQLNPTICELTIRKRIDLALTGKATPALVKLAKNLETGTVGRPGFRFMSKAAFEANQKNLKTGAKEGQSKKTDPEPVMSVTTPVTVETTPVVETVTVVAE